MEFTCVGGIAQQHSVDGGLSENSEEVMAWSLLQLQFPLIIYSRCWVWFLWRYAKQASSKWLKICIFELYLSNQIYKIQVWCLWTFALMIFAYCEKINNIQSRFMRHICLVYISPATALVQVQKPIYQNQHIYSGHFNAIQLPYFLI